MSQTIHSSGYCRPLRFRCERCGHAIDEGEHHNAERSSTYTVLCSVCFTVNQTHTDIECSVCCGTGVTDDYSDDPICGMCDGLGCVAIPRGES